MRALITGIDGFTGRYLAAELLEAGYEVYGLAHKPPSKAIAGVAFIHVCDLGDAAGLARVIEQTQPDVIAHLAAISFVAHGDVDEIYRTNLLGSRNLLDALTKYGKTLTAVLIASSANVYGNSTAGELHESTALAPENDYAVSKLSMEYMARIFANHLPIITVRPFNYTGVGQADNFLIPKIVNHVRRREPVIHLGNLDVARDFSDVRAVVAYYRRLLECRDARGGIFNVCSGRAYTLRDVLGMVREITRFNFEVQVNPAFVRSNEVKVLLGNRDRLLAAVGVVSEVSLAETLRWMLDDAAVA